MEANNAYISLDDIVFEQRNKEYGAYILRKSYRRRMTIAFLFALGFLAVFIAISIIMAYSGNGTVTEIKKVVSISDLAPPPSIKKTPPPPILKLPPPPKTIQFVAPKITDKVVPKEKQMPTMDSLKKAPIVNTPSVPGNNVVFTAPKEVTPTAPKIYRHVEQMPQFPGGITAMYKYLANNVIYPEAARKNNIQGTVYASFVVTSTGEVTDIKILRGLTDAMNKEVIRVIKNMPKWTPGKQNGRAVNVSFNVPCVFKLN